MATPSVFPFRSLLGLLAGVAILCSGSLMALEAERATRGLTQQQFEQFTTKGIPDDQFPRLLELLGREDENAAIRTLFKDQKPFPAGKLIEHLTHARLAVRLGALDLLEDAAGETFSFDPWQEDLAGGANAESLSQWKAWLEKGAANLAAVPLSLDEETFRTLVIEIMSGNRDRAERAMARLDGVGLAALQPIENFLANQPALEAGPKASLRMAEYRIVLRRANPKQAAALARDLALGTFEAQCTALTGLGKLGAPALPVIAEFLDSSDALVRETAVDALFQAGEGQASGLGIDRLKEEKTESVIHALLRGLGKHGGGSQEARNAMLPFLDHSAENVVIATLEALKESEAADVGNAIAAKFSDPRWRVRAAALEGIGTDWATFKENVHERLQDPDQFVRVAAVGAILRGDGAEAVKTLTPVFEKQDDLKAVILNGLLGDSDTPVPASFWIALQKSPPEIILQCLDCLEERGDHEGKRAVHAARFANHPNRDVSAAALRILANHGLETARLLAALTSDDSVKQDAVLDHLHLRAGFLGVATALPADKTAASPGKQPSVIERLYSAFAGKPKVSKPVANVPGDDATPTGEQADPAKMRAALNHFYQNGSPQQRFCAALSLMSQGDLSAGKSLFDSIESMSGLDRRAVAAALSGMSTWPEGPAHDLAVRLLRDPADDVREKAVEAWLKAKSPERLGGLLAELVRPGSLLHPDDFYGWEFDRMAQLPAARAPILAWGKAVLADESSRDSHKVLAVVLLARTNQLDRAQIEKLRESPSPWVRRAAFRALGLPLTDEQVQSLANDESAMVRVIVPFLASPGSGGWVHWFDDEHRAVDSEDSSRNFSSENEFGAWATGREKQSRTPDALLLALERAARDPSEIVRFESLFALLRLGRAIDPIAFAGMVADQPEESRAASRIGTFLQKNYQRLGKAYRVLLPLAHDYDDDRLKKMQKHFGVNDATAAVSIAGLAQQVPTVFRAGDFAVAAPGATAVVERTMAAFRVIFFHKPGCRDCDRVREMLNQHAREFPQMIIEEKDINDRRQALVNEALSARFRLKDVQHQVTPAVFTQGGALVREDLSFPRLGELLRSVSELTPNNIWSEVESREVAAAQETIVERYTSMTFGVVAAAGLLDGINPCAFATIIFLLSYLQVVKRTPGEILAVGVSFISAVFLAYFLVGLGLAQVLAGISALRFAGTLLNYLLAGFALVIAVLSFRDARLAAQGRLSAMTLQLPGGLKDRIRGAVRSGARARRFVIAAFVAGIVVSLLELACTGQVYLPTILYMLKSGSGGAVGHLVVYNVAFVVPLIVVFGLAWTGMRSDALVRFQQERTAMVKVLTGILFLALAAFLLFGHGIMHSLGRS